MLNVPFVWYFYNCNAYQVYRYIRINDIAETMSLQIFNI